MKKLFYVFFIPVMLTIIINLIALVFGNISFILTFFWFSIYALCLVAIVIFIKMFCMITKEKNKVESIELVCPECGQKGSSKSLMLFENNTYYALCSKCNDKEK